MLLRCPPRGNFIPLAAQCARRRMATSSTAGLYTTHEQRTLNDPRDPSTHSALITRITQATKSVRMIDFKVEGKFPFKAGQWVDLFTPGTDRAGGFSIVSAPSQGERGIFRLAIQEAPKNPPAAWLWRNVEKLEGKETVDVRVGGQFTFPPVNVRSLKGKVTRVTLIAGGIGSNPMLSILGALRDSNAPLKVSMLYGIRNAEDALYLEELADYCETINLDLSLFCSQSAETEGLPGTVYHRRFKESDLDATVPDDKETNLYYICGPAQMTDYVQEHLLKQGVIQDLIQTEKWW